MSFFDPSVEVQRISKKVFNETFPETKHRTILLHYHADIMQGITNNLKITLAALSMLCIFFFFLFCISISSISISIIFFLFFFLTATEQQGQTPDEELEDKLFRLHSTSILALNFLLENSPDLELPEAESARANYAKLIVCKFVLFNKIDSLGC
jgi:hypothetical protein